MNNTRERILSILRATGRTGIESVITTPTPTSAGIVILFIVVFGYIWGNR